MAKKINVGVVGYGGAAKNFHLPFITAIPDYNVVAILQRKEAPADPENTPPGTHCTVDRPSIRHYRTPEEFFADDSIDLVVVATHTDTHALFAEKALLAGKHVIADKPFAMSSQEADGVIRLAEEKGLIATCFQNRRWDGGYQTLKKLLSQKALGEVMEAEIHYDFESPSWLAYMTQKEDGMAFGLGSHSVDQAIELFGVPKSVTGFFRCQRGIDSEAEDSFTIILQYGGAQKNLLVTIKTCITTPLAKQLQFFVRGTEGSYVKWQQRSTCPQEEAIAKGVQPLDAEFGREPAHLQGVLTTYKVFDESVQEFDPETQKYTGQYPTIVGRWMGLYENLAGAIRGTDELAVKATQSRDALRVIELARESHDRGVTVAWE